MGLLSWPLAFVLTFAGISAIFVTSLQIQVGDWGSSTSATWPHGGRRLRQRPHAEQRCRSAGLIIPGRRPAPSWPASIPTCACALTTGSPAIAAGEILRFVLTNEDQTTGPEAFASGPWRTSTAACLTSDSHLGWDPCGTRRPGARAARGPAGHCSCGTWPAPWGPCSTPSARTRTPRGPRQERVRLQAQALAPAGPSGRWPGFYASPRDPVPRQLAPIALHRLRVLILGGIGSYPGGARRLLVVGFIVDGSIQLTSRSARRRWRPCATS
jgi:hypothetical protein